MSHGRFPFAIAIVFLAACAGAPPTPAPAPLPTPPPVTTPEEQPETPDAPFRQQPPAPDGKVTFTAPRILEQHLKNGVRVLVSERHDLPVVTVRLVLSVGAGDIPDARPGAISFFGSMLEQGTKKRSALQISDDYEAIGASHGTWFDWDSGGAHVKVLADQLDAALEIMSDIVLSPTFPDAEVERLRARRIATIQSEKSSPGAIAQNVIAAAVFGRSHPYGHSIGGEEIDAKKLTRAELLRTYDRLFVPANATIIVTGDIAQATLLPRLEARFGGWRPRSASAKRIAPKVPSKPPIAHRIVLVDRPGAQSQVHVVRVGVPFGTKDRESIVVMNAILGGMFSSRVNLNLREKNAFTYGARSHIGMRHGAGPLTVGAAVFADKTGPAIKEIFNEIEGLRRDGPNEEELALAKESIRLAMPGRFETSSEVAAAIGELVTHDLAIDEFEKRPARVDAVTANDVKRVAGELLVSGAMTVVVVGDKTQVAPQLEVLALGPFEERDPYGNPIPSRAPAAPPKRKSAPR